MNWENQSKFAIFILNSFVMRARGLPLITYASGGRGGGGVKSLIHFYCVLHAERGLGGRIACKDAYVINGRPPTYHQIDQRSCYNLIYQSPLSLS